MKIKVNLNDFRNQYFLLLDEHLSSPNFKKINLIIAKLSQGYMINIANTGLYLHINVNSGVGLDLHDTSLRIIGVDLI